MSAIDEILAEDEAADRRKAILASVKVQTLAEICRTDFPPLRWYARDLLPSGFTIIAAPSKTGKSFFVLQLAGALAEGAPFLRQPTIRSETLYLCLEAGARGLKARATMNRLGGVDGIHVVTDLGTADPLRFIEAFHSEHPAVGVVIVDVLARVRPIQPNGPQYGAEYQELTPWRELAERLDIAIVGVTHTRKSPSETGDFVDEIYGSGAVSGVPNGIIQLRRPRGSPRTVLKASFRDARDLELVLHFDAASCLWTATDEDVSEAELTPERKRILATLKDAPDGLRNADIRIRAGIPSAQSTSNILSDLLSLDLVQKVGSGKYTIRNPGVNGVSGVKVSPFQGEFTPDTPITPQYRGVA